MPFDPVRPHQTEAEIAALALEHLQRVVAIDSASDEHSETIPSTEGQRRLSRAVGEFFEQQGCRVGTDRHANVIAELAGRGALAADPPVAQKVHLDTARGTRAVPQLAVLRRWDGRPIPFPANPALQVGVETYPATSAFVGQDLVHGPGDCPFGLDDKLGLAHLMTLARLLAANSGIPHPPLLLVGRPDEEIGRMAAVEGLADELARRGVRHGWTIDGIVPFEVNVENFHASQATVSFPRLPVAADGLPHEIAVALGGVNTHGCTAKAEGYRAATRFASQVAGALEEGGLSPARILPARFVTDAARECDAELAFRTDGSPEVTAALRRAVEAAVGPHLARGASFRAGAEQPAAAPGPVDGAVSEMLRFVRAFLTSTPGFVLPAEASEGREGYSNPFRSAPLPDGGQALDVRLRDFDRAALTAREEHVAAVASGFAGARVAVRQQYVNMGPRLEPHAHLADWPREAAAALGQQAPVLPIRGGTGVDPFLERGIPVANLGTGYFAPESEKEFTTLQLMARHALWLTLLVQRLRTAPDGRGA
jgi:tripeptide aminopeptidase